ncbi:hypothetical protein D3C80_1753840 [compost metagenome]
MPVDRTYRRGDAANLILVFLKVEGVALFCIAAHPLHPDGASGGIYRRAFGGVEVAPLWFGLVEDQGLAQTGRGNGVTLPQTRADVDAATAGHLVQIESKAAVQNAQMHGVVGHR